MKIHNMTGIIIQARTGSSRLPDKMILPFYGEKSIVELLIDRLKKLELNIPIILATTTSSSDDVLYKTAIDNDIEAYRGSEENVLDRFIKAGEKYGLNKIIRICADNPLIETASLSRLIEEFNKSDVDYWCYATNDNTPTIKTHYGFWTEGITLDALKKVASLTSDKIYIEHVTNYVYTHADVFTIHYETIDSYVQSKNIRLTIDTLEDFKLVQTIYSEIQDENIEQTAHSITNFVASNHEWLGIMQKEIQNNSK